MALAGANRIGASASVAIVTGETSDRRRRRPKQGREREDQGDAGGLLVRSKRVILIVMDSCGCGELARRGRLRRRGSNTLGNIARVLGGLTLPHLQGLGLGNLTTILGVPPAAAPRGRASARCARPRPARTRPPGTGRWPACASSKPFPTFPDGFPPEIIDAVRAARPAAACSATSRRRGPRSSRSSAPSTCATGKLDRLHLGRLGVPDRGARGGRPARRALPDLRDRARDPRPRTASGA